MFHGHIGIESIAPRLPCGFAQGTGALLGAPGEEHATDGEETWRVSSVCSWGFFFSWGFSYKHRT